MKPPQMVNKIYRLAGVWVKPGARSKVGTCLMELAKKYDAQKNVTKQGEEEDKKPPRDMSKLKCYGCGEKEHMANSKLCPKYKQKQEEKAEAEAFINTTCCEEIKGSIEYTKLCRGGRLIQYHLRMWAGIYCVHARK